MALEDYYLCDVCDGKTFYDAQLDYRETEDGPWLPNGAADIAVLCQKCAKTHEVVVREKEGDR